MIGCRNQSSNDIYIFFNTEDIKDLENGKISGHYFHTEDFTKPSELEAIVNNEIDGKYELSSSKKEEETLHDLILSIRPNVYTILAEKGLFESHEGYRHIHLLSETNDKSWPNPIYRLHYTTLLSKAKQL